METRQIELSLDTAKRWYEQGGELKEMALGAYSEQELIGDRLPKTWNEYCAKYGEVGDKIKASLNTAYMAINTYIFSDYKQAQAHIAKMKLHLLRDEYRQGWKPNWSEESIKFVIKRHLINGEMKLVITSHWYDPIFLSFPTEQTADEFFTNFLDLIKEAGDLI